MESMEGNRRNEVLKARLKKALRQHRTVMRELEDALDGLGVSSDSSNEMRFRLGRMASDYLRLTDEAIAARLLTNRDLITEEKPAAYSQLLAGPEIGTQKSRSKRPTREIVLELLEELGVPAAPSTVAKLASYSGRGRMAPSLFSSLLRDEKRSFEAKPVQDSYSNRNIWVVPALETGSFRKKPGFIASSAWEPERRLIGKNTVKAISLRTILSLFRFAETQKQESSQGAAHVISWATDLSLHILEIDMKARTDATHEQLISTIRRELDLIESADAAERRESARKLTSKPREIQLWGASL